MRDSGPLWSRIHRLMETRAEKSRLILWLLPVIAGLAVLTWGCSWRQDSTSRAPLTPALADKPAPSTPSSIDKEAVAERIMAELENEMALIEPPRTDYEKAFNDLYPIYLARLNEEKLQTIRKAAARAGDELTVLYNGYPQPLTERLRLNNPPTRAAAACVLGFIRDPRAAEILSEAFYDTAPVVFEAAIDAAIRMADTKLLARIIHIAATEKNESGKLAAGKIASGQAPWPIEELIANLSNGDDQFILAATRALGRSRDVTVLETLRSLHSSPKPHVRAAAVEALWEAAGTGEMVFHLDALGDPHPSVRAAAAAILGRSRDAKILPHLLSALADPSPQVRLEAAKALAGFTADLGPHIRTLELRLFDEQWEIRKETVGILDRMNGDEPQYGLMIALKDGDENVRKAAIKALGRRDSDAAVQALLPLVTDQRVSDDVLIALSGMRVRLLGNTPLLSLIDSRKPAPEINAFPTSDKGVPLQEPKPSAAGDTRDDRGAASKSAGEKQDLADLFSRVVGTGPDHRPSVEAAQTMAGQDHALLLDFLANRVRSNPILHPTIRRQAAAIVLGEMDDPQATRALVESAGDPTDPVYWDILHALAGKDDPWAVQKIRREMEIDRKTEPRRRAAKRASVILRAFGINPSSAALMLDEIALGTDRPYDTRTMIYRLKESYGSWDGAILERAILHAEDAGRKMILLDAAVKIAPPGTQFPVIEETQPRDVRHGNLETRAQAIRCLGREASANVVTELSGLLRELQGRIIRAEPRENLWLKHGNYETFKVLYTLRNPQEWIDSAWFDDGWDLAMAVSALNSFGKCGGGRRTSLKTEADLRTVLAQVLCAAGDAGAGEAMVAALDDPFWDVAVNAAEYVAKLKIPEAESRLIDMLNRRDDPFSRNLAALALARMESAEGFLPLWELAGEDRLEPWVVRQAAKDYAGLLERPEYHTILSGIADRKKRGSLPALLLPRTETRSNVLRELPKFLRDSQDYHPSPESLLPVEGPVSFDLMASPGKDFLIFSEIPLTTFTVNFYTERTYNAFTGAAPKIYFLLDLSTHPPEPSVVDLMILGITPPPKDGDKLLPATGNVTLLLPDGTYDLHIMRLHQKMKDTYSLTLGKDALTVTPTVTGFTNCANKTIWIPK